MARNFTKGMDPLVNILKEAISFKNYASVNICNYVLPLTRTIPFYGIEYAQSLKNHGEMG